MSLLGELPLLLTVLLLWLLVSLLLAPIEALGWWAGWFEGDEEKDPEPEPPDKPIQLGKIDAYLVYLTGISGVSGDVLLDEEVTFIERLDAALPTTVVVKDVYPYSVRNRALTGQRVFAWFWRFALNMKLSDKPRRRLIGLLINIRNAFQVMVSADRRYGPIYNSAFARLIVQALLRYGYRRGSGMPVYIVGYSGGGQIAAGVVPYLKKMLGAPITVISLGGVVGAEPGIMEAEHLYHLYGRRDSVQRLGWILSPSRWTLGDGVDILPLSRWNQAKRRDMMTFIYMGNMRHNGREGYLDDEFALDEHDKPNLDVTVDTIADLLKQHNIETTSTVH